MARFADAARLREFARRVGDAAGRPVAVRFAEPPRPARDAPIDGGEPGSLSRDAASRRAAMDLPLVREALEVFPEATLLDVRSEKDG